VSSVPFAGPACEFCGMLFKMVSRRQREKLNIIVLPLLGREA